MSEIYNRNYYLQYDVGSEKVNYEGSKYTEVFLTEVAKHIVEDLHPRTVLDAGCAMGYLVAALRDCGVEAYGIDISEYAISKVREDIRSYCVVGSLTESLPQSLPQQYDLVVTIEVLEHLYSEDGKIAIKNLCSWSNCVLFSSTSDGYCEPTHFNVQQREFWVRQFAANDFADNLNYRPTYLSSNAICFQKGTDWLRQVEDYERTIRISESELKKYRETKSSQCRTQAFFDTGSGFREEESECHYHSYTEDFEFCVPIEENVRHFRIDPVDGYAIVTIKKCYYVSDKGISDLPYQTNGIPIGNAIMFDTEDPQIWFPDLGSRVSEVRVLLNVVHITTDVLENYGRLYYTAKREQQRLNRQLTEINARLQRKENECKRLEQRCSDMDTELEMWKGKDAQLNRQLSETDARLQIKVNEFQQLEQRCSNMDAELEAWKGKNTQLNRQLTEKDAELQAGKTENEWLKEQLVQAEEAYHAILNAFFWKITKPVRVILDYIKRLLKLL